MDRMSSIKFAIKNEHDEMEFYLEQAKRSTNEVVISVFRALAQDEKEHMKRIRFMHGKLVADGAWPKDIPIEVEGTQVSSTLAGMKRDESTKVHDKNDIDALKKSAKFEASGQKFYKELSEECDNPQEKKFFAFLSQIENEHYISVKDSIFYLEDPEAWFEEKDRSSLDGG